MAKDDDKKGDGQATQQGANQPKGDGASPEIQQAPDSGAPAPVVQTPVTSQGQPTVVYVQAPAAVIPEPIPDFDKTVPGGKYLNAKGEQVDAFGQPFKGDQQDPEVLRRAMDRHNGLMGGA